MSFILIENIHQAYPNLALVFFNTILFFLYVFSEVFSFYNTKNNTLSYKKKEAFSYILTYPTKQMCNYWK
ncbi:hypothetical protein [Aquimarina hainanensis]|uniref:hypothetical protein n=1 Tax=Aquimarina hainanensis TaxID=1578017 RepID=UPI00362457EC